MTKFVAVVSAKGGVGKTTTSINLSSALDWFRRDVIVIDANFATPDIGINLGTPFEKNIHRALAGEHDVKESIYRHPSGLRIVPGHVSYAHARNVKKENIMNLVQGMMNLSEIVFIDTTPGIGEDTRPVLQSVDYVIVITTPELCAVTNSIKMVKLSHELGKQVLGVIVNRRTGENHELNINNIQTMTGCNVLGIIPEDHSVASALHQKNPVLVTHPESDATLGFKKVAGELIGERYVENIQQEERSSFREALRKLGF